MEELQTLYFTGIFLKKNYFKYFVLLNQIDPSFSKPIYVYMTRCNIKL